MKKANQKMADVLAEAWGTHTKESDIGELLRSLATMIRQWASGCSANGDEFLKIHSLTAADLDALANTHDARKYEIS